jgi:hypothetical protein
MPEFAKWINDHRYDGARSSPEQKALRQFYSRLINLVGEPAFRDGKFFPLNSANHDNPRFGRLPGEPASGHWLYAFLRYDSACGQRFLVVANLHPTLAFSGVVINIPRTALEFLHLSTDSNVTLTERLHDGGGVAIDGNNVSLAQVAPLSACYLEFALNG